MITSCICPVTFVVTIRICTMSYKVWHSYRVSNPVLDY